MSFRSILRDVRDGFGSLSRRSFEVRLSGNSRGKSHGPVHEFNDEPLLIQTSRWASLPPNYYVTWSEDWRRVRILGLLGEMLLLVLLYVGHGGTCAKKWSKALSCLGKLPSQSP